MIDRDLAGVGEFHSGFWVRAQELALKRRPRPDGSARPAPTAAPGVRQRMVLAGLGRAERSRTSPSEP